jgi:hypothetical protein
MNRAPDQPTPERFDHEQEIGLRTSISSVFGSGSIMPCDDGVEAFDDDDVLYDGKRAL